MVNCAAFTAVDAAESDPERAHAVNAAGPGIIARACATAGARMIHISTDYVFSGAFDGAPRPYDVDDATGPLSVYGKTKLAGEHAVHEALPDAHVVRTAWVYTGVGIGLRRQSCAGWRQATSPSTWSSTRSGRPPTSGDLVAALLEIAERPDGAAAAAHRQRGRGQPVRAGARGVRRRRSRSRPGAAGGHRGRASARGATAVFGAVRSRRDGGGAGAVAAVA